MNAVEYIHSLKAFGKKAELKNIERLLDALGNPHKGMKYVHVAGTNGKGSVSSFLNSIFRLTNKRVGLFTSPFIECFNERICVNDIPISDNELEEITQEVKKHVEALSLQNIYCTVFDVICAVGFVHFKRCACDVVVLEVGLGGRFDATNIIEAPLCSVICAIGYDHTQYLGETLSEIAFEKCGIIKNGCPVVSYCSQHSDSLEVIKKSCADKNAALTVADIKQLKILSCDATGSKFVYKGKEYTVTLVGEYQIYNSLCAIEAAYLCGADYHSVACGLAGAKWKCRFELFSAGDKTIVIDGAHNPHGLAAFLKSVRMIFPEKEIHYVFGMLNDKDVEKSCDVLATANGNITVTSVPSDRGDNPFNIYKCLLSKSRKDTEITYIEDSLQAVEHALCKKCDVVCVVGSLYMAGAVRKFVENFSQNDKTI